MIPWKYHQLTPRDMSGELLRKWNKFAAGTTGVASEAGAQWIVAEDNLLVLTTIGFSSAAFAGGAQCIGCRLDILHNNISEFQATELVFNNRADVGGQMRAGAIRPVYIIVPGGATVSITVIFTTNADHGWWVSAAGVLIPRGGFGDF